jgi:hypothetical protein
MKKAPQDQGESGLPVSPIAARGFVLRGDVCAGPYPILELSESSVLFAGDMPFGIGERCAAILEVPGQIPQTLDAEPVLAAKNPASHIFGMAFLNLSEALRDCLLELKQSCPSSNSNYGGKDRRRFPRVRVAGTAVVLVSGRYIGTYVVRNLSAGGVQLVGDNNLTIGQAVHLLLRVGGEFSQDLDAEVVRREKLPSGEQSFAVAFRELVPDIEDSLQNLALLALEGALAQKKAAVLVLNSPSAVESAFEEDVRSLGRDVVAVVTPLDALSLLSSDTHHIVAAVVACDFARADPLGFLNFMKDAYPHIRRIALVGKSRPGQLDRAIATGVVEAILGEPWGIDLLSQALGL